MLGVETEGASDPRGKNTRNLRAAYRPVRKPSKEPLKEPTGVLVGALLRAPSGAPLRFGLKVLGFRGFGVYLGVSGFRVLGA